MVASEWNIGFNGGWCLALPFQTPPRTPAELLSFHRGGFLLCRSGGLWEIGAGYVPAEGPATPPAPALLSRESDPVTVGHRKSSKTINRFLVFIQRGSQGNHTLTDTPCPRQNSAVFGGFSRVDPLNPGGQHGWGPCAGMSAVPPGSYGSGES